MERYQASLPILKALSDETRLSILALLTKDSLNCCQIKEAFACSQPRTPCTRMREVSAKCSLFLPPSVRRRMLWDRLALAGMEVLARSFV